MIMKVIKTYSNIQIKNNYLEDNKTLETTCTSRTDWRKAVSNMMLIKLINMQ